MKKMTALLLTVTLCFPMGMSAYAESESGETDYTTGTPWLCSDLEGNVTADTPADPKDDYALWANKDRILKMEIPPGYISACNTTDVNIKGTEDMIALFQGEAPEDHDSRLAYDYFYLLSDWDTRDDIGVAPLKEMVDIVEGISSIDALTEYFVKTPAEDRLFSLWEESVEQDMDNPGTQILFIAKGKCLMNDPEEYREMTDYGIALIEAYKDFFGRMLEKLGYSEEEAKQKFDNCLEWEMRMNSVLASFEERQSSEYLANTNVHYTHDELLAATPDIPLLETLEKADGYPVLDQYLIQDPAIIEKLNELYTEDNLQLIRDYMIIHGIYENAEALDWESYALSIDCQEMVLGGEHSELNKEIYSEDYVYDEMNISISWALAKFYVPGYEEVGDTAFITFGNFERERENYYDPEIDRDQPQDTIDLIIYAHKQITREDSPVKNIVLDLSNNGGGDFVSAIYVISWFLGEADIALRDVFTGAETNAMYLADVNLDGEFNEDDTVGNGYKLYCLTSNCSFSCGNLVPAACKSSGKVTLVGQTTGGGSCVVLPCTTAAGAVFRISGSMQMSIIKNGSFYNTDSGIDPHFFLDKPESFYDRPALAEYLRELR